MYLSLRELEDYEKKIEKREWQERQRRNMDAMKRGGLRNPSDNQSHFTMGTRGRDLRIAEKMVNAALRDEIRIN